jgi:hypothetical protein
MERGQPVGLQAALVFPLQEIPSSDAGLGLQRLLADDPLNFMERGATAWRQRSQPRQPLRHERVPFTLHRRERFPTPDVQRHLVHRGGERLWCFAQGTERFLVIRDLALALRDGLPSVLALRE